MIIFAGAILLAVWTALTFVSRGVPPGLCDKIGAVLPPAAHVPIMRMRSGFYYDVPNKEMPSAVFFLLFTCAFFIYAATLLYISSGKGKRNSGFTIIVFAVLFRLVLIPSVPIHENDIYRYIWDGKVLLSGVNPYKYPPEAAEVQSASRMEAQGRDVLRLESLRDGNPVYFSRIGHRQVPTIYPPVAELVFAAGDFVRMDSITLMKSIFVLFDILVILVLYRLLLRLKMNPCMVAVYAWSPLVLKETANSGHCDTLAIFFLLMALLLLVSGRLWGTVLCSSFAVLSKLFPLVTMPLILRRTKWKPSAVFVVVVAGFYLPFFFWGGTGPRQVFAGLTVYARVWSIYGGIFEFVYSFLQWLSVPVIKSQYYFAKAACAAAYAVILLFLTARAGGSDRAFFKRIFWALAWLFLLSPVGDPWYFCWVIPFLCFFPYRSFLLLSWLLVFNYLSFTMDIRAVALGGFSISMLIAAQYIPFYALLTMEVMRERRGRGFLVSRS